MNRPTFIPDRLKKKLETYRQRIIKISGFDPTENNRHRIFVTGRAIIVYKLILEGYTEHQVATVLGKDHSTIHYYRDKMETILHYGGYDIERELWAKFIHYDEGTD